ncbi:MAG TPA: ABC transporter permease [Bryobacteraceae bacterium]|nr:ABC transporter permease [Bryobacteraceae bacterium]
MGKLRQVIRTLLRAPGFAIAAITTLTLGVAASIIVFVIFDAIVLRPLPYRHPDRLVMIWDQLTRLGLDEFPATLSNYRDYLQSNSVFEDIAAFQLNDMNLAGAAATTPQRISVMAIGANFLPLMGVAPELGRAFTEQETQPGRDTAVLLSDALWREHFGGVPDILGKTVTLDDRQFVIAGVMAPNFRFALANDPAPDMLVPLVLPATDDGRWGNVRLLARMKPGVSPEQAQANMTQVAAALQSARHPYTGPHGEDAGYRVRVVPLHQQLLGGIRAGAWVLFGAVILVLFIACGNVANLLLAHRLGRRREFAIRIALGAMTRHLLQELAAEGFALAATASLAGGLLAAWAIRAIPKLITLPEAAAIQLDWRIAAFAAALMLGTALFSELGGGWWIAMKSRIETTGSRVAGQGSSRLRKVLIAAEVALSFVLLAGAGLLIESFWRLSRVDPGFDPRGVLSMRVTLPAYKYANPEQRTAYFQRTMAEIGRLPGVQSASLVSNLPLSGGRGGGPFSIEGRPYRTNGAVPQAAVLYNASPAYFQTLHIPLLAGRTLEDRDTAEAPLVTVVNETLARGFWPSMGDALGKRIVLGAPRPNAPWMTIVGVVADVRNTGLRVEPIPQIYRPYPQAPSQSAVLLARTAGDPMTLALAVRRAAGTVDPEQPIYDVKTLDQRVSSSIQNDRFQTLLLGAFAALALLLACVGIYSVLEHAIEQRTSEIGIRMAVGARPVDIMRLALAQGMLPATAGIAAGFAAALALTRLLRVLLFGVSPHDPVVLLSIAALLAIAALAASLGPAGRAMRVDPVVALREE